MMPFLAVVPVIFGPRKLCSRKLVFGKFHFKEFWKLKNSKDTVKRMADIYDNQFLRPKFLRPQFGITV